MAVECAGNDLGGLLTGGYYGGAEGDLLQQCGDIGCCDYFKESIGSVVFQAAYLGGSVVEGQASLGAEFLYRGLVEAFFFDYAEVVFIVEMYQADDAPEVVDPVGVIKWHAPAMGLRREAAQKEYLGVLGQEGLKGMRLCVHWP